MTYQPLALRGNPFSDAYYAALRRVGGAVTPPCAYCGARLGPAPYVSDGQFSWCSAGHRTLWARQEVNKQLGRSLVERGWTPERWAARLK